MENDYTISKFDRIRSGQRDVALFAKPSTIRNLQTLTGRVETFIIETARSEDGDYIFVECVDESGSVIRLALPPKVANAVAAQRDSLTTRRRSIAGKIIAQARKDRGELPGFMRKKSKN